MSLRIFDTLASEKRDFVPLEEGKVRMYVCGITPYDRPHLGHARCYVTWDIVFRYLKFRGFDVTYVRNFTDVDDKIIKRANERGISSTDLAEENIGYFYEDMDALKIERPHIEPRVTTTIPEIIDIVKTLVDRGVAYEAEGDVYYAVEKFDGYGKLSKRSIDDMQAGARVEVSEKKRHPMDFALWKAAKPDEPSWDSPWGKGRPGWHIECSAMSMKHLGETFDIHGGGRDLIFPHHENEIAQSEGATGAPNVRYWMHNGFVNIDDEKMSKSLGNFFTVHDVLEHYTAETLRFFFVAGSHYRGPINFTDAMLDEAACRIAYLHETLRKAEALVAEDLGGASVEGPLPHADIIEQLEGRFLEAMDDDVNIPKAMDPISEAFKALNELIETRKQKQRPKAQAAAKKLLSIIRRLDAVTGVFARDVEGYLAEHRAKCAKRKNVDVAWIERVLGERIDARKAKDWAQADKLRDDLLVAGVKIMDAPGDKTEWTLDDLAGGC